MKIYTRTGDRGDTGLFGGGRVPKDDARVEAYGAVDELNAVLGVAIARLREDDEQQTADRLETVQADLFSLGAHLATPAAEDGGRATAHVPDLPEGRVGEMEGWIDEAEAELEPLKVFILPGGGESAARLHHARTVCRRAERRVITLARDARLDDLVVVYLNRLSDLLFTLARLANRRAGTDDVPWAGRTGGT
jgi:cob(I)alamin adenosyltransferase